MPLSADFFGALRRTIGDDVGPATSDLELVAVKIWRESLGLHGKGAAAHLPRNFDHSYYRRAAHIALTGLPEALAI